MLHRQALRGMRSSRWCRRILLPASSAGGFPASEELWRGNAFLLAIGTSVMKGGVSARKWYVFCGTLLRPAGTLAS